MRKAPIAVVLTLLAGCAIRPSPREARELLDGGDASAALKTARGALAEQLEPAEALDAHRVAFEAALALDRADEAAREVPRIREAEACVPEANPARDDSLFRRLAEGALGGGSRSRDESRRARAADALLVAGPDAPAALVTRALQDPLPAVRRAAAPIGALADPLSLAKLLGLDPDDSVREAAARALCDRLATARATTPPEVIEALVSAADHDRSELVRAVAGQARGHAEKPASVEPRALGSPDYHQRLLAFLSVASRAPWSREEGAPLAKLAADALAKDEVALVRAAAADAVAALGGPGADAALARAARGDEDPTVRRRAFLALDRLSHRDPPALVAVLAQGDPALVADAARLLAERTGHSGSAMLVQAIGHSTVRGRAAVARALGLLPASAESQQALIAALDDGAAVVRSAAASSLARIGTGPAREALVRAVTNTEEDADLAAAAALLVLDKRAREPVAAARATEGP
jgi:HEAT repeat protein